MAVTEERFVQGLTYDAYKAQMTRNQERFESNEHHFVPDAGTLAALQQYPGPLHVFVLAEDWCGDVIDNLPILGRLAKASNKLDVRIFLRDQHPDLMDMYLKDGQFRSIPVFVFFDEEFQELGRFIERPDSTTTRRNQFRQEFFAKHPELGTPDTSVEQLSEEARVQFMQALGQMREDSKSQDEQDVAQALRAIIAPAG